MLKYFWREAEKPGEGTAMSIQVREVNRSGIETLLPILQDADEGIERIRATLQDEKHVSYAAFDHEQLVGALTVYWDEHESELIYLAVTEGLRRRGYGQAILMTLLCDEARKRGIRSLLVGTANSSWDTIGFYQRCGFRMDHVRKDFFSYIQPPIEEGGIVMRDMLVLRYTFEEKS
jgi:ribosomal protein S18 acetylase RimI-like enzyme